MLDAVVAAIMGLSMADLRHVLAECDKGAANINGQNRKGFWRIDKDKTPNSAPPFWHSSHSTTLKRELQPPVATANKVSKPSSTRTTATVGCFPKSYDSWDYGLGHDERAKHLQPVVSRLGLRFYDFQLIQSANESWRECQLHARNVLGRSYAALSNESVSPQFYRDRRDSSDEPLHRAAERGLVYPTGRTLRHDQGDLFEKVDD